MSMKVKNIDLSPTMYAPTLPYNPLSPLPPASDVESTLVLKRCVGARAALARLLRTEAPKIYPRELIKLIFS